MLAAINQRLSACRAGREDAELRLRAYLHLATNTHAFYLACDEGHRRLCNQAFFAKITLAENLDVTSEFTGVYETILDPTNRLPAEFWQRTSQLDPDIDPDHNEATLPTDHGAGLELRPNGGPNGIQTLGSAARTGDRLGHAA